MVSPVAEFRAETLSWSGCCYACGILGLLRLDLNLVMLLLLSFLYTRSRLVVNLLGRGGYIISEMRRATGASIHVFPREQAPKCGARNDEVVQVINFCEHHSASCLVISFQVFNSCALPFSFIGLHEYSTTT